jgi:hypothetical protein
MFNEKLLEINEFIPEYHSGDQKDVREQPHIEI